MLNLGRRSGLARTKENFPSLGGGSSADVASTPSGNASARSQQQKAPPISSVLRTRPTSATGAIPRTTNSASGSMVLHVSNRPQVLSTPTNNTSSASKKNSAFDFPALPSGKTKKIATKSVALEEDLAPSNVKLPMTTVAAKHRTLVDDYVSVANPATFQKIQMVQKEEMEMKARKEAAAKNAPKLTSQDFPSLGGATRSSAAGAGNSWIKQPVLSEKRQKGLENRKNKVAPPPVFGSSKNGSGNNSNSSKLMTQISSSSSVNSIASSSSSSKKEKKAKEKNNNNISSANKNTNSNNNENKAINQNLSNGNATGSNREKQNNSPTKNAYKTNVTVNSVAKPANNLTFTNSSGESYSIVPTHSYASPPDAAARNQVRTKSKKRS